MIVLRPIDKADCPGQKFRRGKHTIGRSSNNDFEIDEPVISRKHALLEIVDSENILLTDLHSSNGTRVNGNPIATTTQVYPGDEIEFGDIRFLLERADTANDDTSDTITIYDTGETKESSLVLPWAEARRLLPRSIFHDPHTSWALAEIGTVVVEPDNLSEILASSLKLLREAVSAERVAVLMDVDTETDIRVVASSTAGAESANQFHISKTIIQEILTNLVAILITDAQSDSRFSEQSPTYQAGLRSAMAIPLLDNETMQGILYADISLDSVAFTEDHLRAFAAFGHILSTKLANQKLIQHRQEKAVLEAELRVSNQKQEELSEVNRQLRDAQAQLVQTQKMVALGRIVAGIVHELNTPLSSMKANADLLRRLAERLASAMAEEGVGLDDSGQPRSDLASGASESLAQGISRVQEFLRSLKLFAGLDEAEWHAASINDGIRTTIDLIQIEPEARVEIQTDLHDVPLIYCNPAALNQVFWALLTNAREALSGSGHIYVGTRIADDTVEITVRDNGCGIPKSDLRHILDAGFTTKGGRVRMGLGLATCHQIIDQHHGTIRIDSEVGKGTTVTVNLPLHRKGDPAES